MVVLANVILILDEITDCFTVIREENCYNGVLIIIFWGIGTKDVE